VLLSNEAFQTMNDKNPSTFCTVEFFEHEIQATPVIKATNPEYNFTSQYVVRVDDFFLYYLQKEKISIELHHVIASDYETKAACQISLHELIEKQTLRLNGYASLICVLPDHVDKSFGQLEYWVRLIVPVDEAFRQYKERTKSLGYIASNIKAVDQYKKSHSKMRLNNNMNELNINIIRCSKVKSLLNDKQPSVYCVYKFYDFKDNDSEIIGFSNYPEFNDHKSFAVLMDMDLDKYLKNSELEIYVFDDNDLIDSGKYIGLVKIPLISLAQDKDIKGTFQLTRVKINLKILIILNKIKYSIIL
jgi:protein fantom